MKIGTRTRGCRKFTKWPLICRRWSNAAIQYHYTVMPSKRTLIFHLRLLGHIFILLRWNWFAVRTGLQFEPYRWCPCGVTWDSSRTVVVIKLRRTSALRMPNFCRSIHKGLLNLSRKWKCSATFYLSFPSHDRNSKPRLRPECTLI